MKKQLLILTTALITFVAVNGQNVGINTTTPHPSSELDVTSTNKGFLAPRMTQAQRNAIASPATGLLIYQTDVNPGFYTFNGTVWTSMNNPEGLFKGDASLISYRNTGNFGKDFLVNTNIINNSGNEERYKMMFLPSKKGAFRVGAISNKGWDMDSIGDHSFAAGFNNRAKGEVSVALGMTSIASGFASVVLGRDNVASGDYATAMGYLNSATNFNSFAIGYENQSTGYHSMAFGTGNISSSNFSNAMGNNTIANGYASTTMGERTTASGPYTTAMGFHTTASGYGSTAMGWYNNAKGDSSTAMGSSTTAYGASSTAMGNRTSASGKYATAMGNASIALGESSTAIGKESRASGFASFASGITAVASGNWSTALGSEVTASSNGAVAIGESVTSSGYQSFGAGYSITASGYGAAGMGSFLTASGNYSTALGNFVSTNAKEGSFIIGDRSSTTTFNSSAANQMTMRFGGGYRLFTNAEGTYGVLLGPYSSSWSTVSDSTKKENFRPAPDFLSKIAKMRIGSWNYKDQDKSLYRHYGPMAQEFYTHFGNDGIGIIGNDTTIASADIDGVMMIAIQQLIKENENLKDDLKKVNERLSKIEAILSKNQSAEE